MNIKKLLCLLLAVVMVLSMAACNPTEENPESTPGGNVSGTNGKYTVTIQTQGKMPLEGIDVQIYDGDNLMEYKKTDATGKAAFEMAANDNYKVVLNGVPAGYKVEESYSFSNGQCLITLKTQLIENSSLSGASFSLGDVMYNFSVTDVDGNTHTVADILKEKKVLILNFYFNGCGPCRNEMPAMQTAYEKYAEKAEILAINPQTIGGQTDETENGCKVFRDELGLTFPVCKVDVGWQTMADGGYPTTYVVDRYGVVVFAEAGTEPSVHTWTTVMEYFSADDYEQKLIESFDQIVARIPPAYEDMDPADIAAVLGDAEGNIVYSNEVEDEFCWPYISAEKNGEVCLKASNSGIASAYSILYLDVTMKAGQALGFDYLISSESGMDLFHVIAEDTPIYSISGVNTVEQWESCYAWVAPKDGTYRIGLTYIKDDSDDAGDDTVYIKNVRLVDTAEIDTPTYIPREAAVTYDEFTYEYATIVYNENDGYYHVNTADGPLLLANLQTVSQFNTEDSLYNMALNGQFVLDGHDYCDDLTPYASYAINSKMTNYCTVTKELAELLQLCVEMVGFEEEANKSNEWLKLCRYYDSFGSSVQLEDPVAGLATFSAFEAKLGNNEMPFDEGIAIMPRGKYAKFVPTKSGVYKVTTTCDPDTLSGEMHGYIFGDNHAHLIGNTEDKTNIVAESMRDERWIEDADNFTMVAYLEAGKAYYINLFFYDIYDSGVITYKLEHVAASYNYLRMASPGPWTAELLPGGELGATIPGGIDVVYNESTGYYHEDLGKDANGNQLYGGILYCDFYGSYTVVSNPVVGNGSLLELGAFDRSKTEDDKTILKYIEMYDGDREKVEEALRSHWTESYYEESKQVIEDVFEGKYHGSGEDKSARIEWYRDNKMIKSGELEGMVPVDKELAQLLDGVIHDYVFPNIVNGWIKFCCYYDALGPA